ncbi:MAG: hypothetical protein OXU69_15510 [Gemmatimonadota bacterium]|nr:hypothetical protein [Gemmatimonadota bacterium]MDE2986108.1 hypothetical protein [Gemmatimonadota bacterium]
MNIIKASIRNAVRRKWKFALVVFLFGVGLAVLTNVYDVVGAAERMDAAFGGEEPPSDEQLGEVARSGAMIFLFGTLGLFFAFGSILFAFLLPGGMVANERESTAIMLWAQHPMPLSSFYMWRYLGVQAVALAAMLVFGLVAAVSVLPGETASATGVGNLVSVCLEGVLACAVSFAITAHGIRRAAFFGMVFYLASGVSSGVLPLAEQSTSAIAGLARGVLPFVLFPVSGIDDLTRGFASEAAWDWGATGMVLYHFAVWTAIAWLGLRRMERRPLKL